MWKIVNSAKQLFNVITKRGDYSDNNNAKAFHCRAANCKFSFFIWVNSMLVQCNIPRLAFTESKTQSFVIFDN